MTTPTIGTVSTQAFLGSTGTVRTMAFTVAAATKLLRVRLKWTGLATISSVLWNGAAMAVVAGTTINRTNSDGTSAGMATYELVNPTAGGPFNVVANHNVSGLVMGAQISNHDNVDTTTPSGNPTSAFTDTPNAAPALGPITSTTNDMADAGAAAYDPFVDMARVGNNALGTKLTEAATTSISFIDAYATTLNPTFNWSLTTLGTGGNVQAGSSIKGTGAGGGVKLPTRINLGLF